MSSGQAPLRPVGSAAAGVLTLVVLAALSMAASGAADTAPPPAPATTPAAVSPVQQTEVACPDFPSSGTTVVDVSSQGSGTGSLSAGAGKLRDLPSTAGVFSVSGQADSGVLVVADGSPAAGLVAIRQDTTSSTSASVDCVAPAVQWWFAGAGASLDHHSFLLLRNLATGSATLQLRVFSPQGESEPLIDSQLVIAPTSQKRIDLALLATLSKELTVSVVAVRGEVVAAMHDSVTGADGTSVGWLAGVPSPQRTLVFTGDFGSDAAGGGADELVVTNPAHLDASVSVQVAGANGWFTPLSTPPVRVGPGRVVTIDLAGAVSDGVRAVRVVSTRPVVGVLRRTASSDFSESEPLPLLSVPGAAVVPQGRTASLVLLGGPQGGSALVSWSGADGHVIQSRAVALGDSESAVVKLPDGARRVDVVPGKGGIYAGITVRGPGLDTLAVGPVLAFIPQPVVVPVSQ